MPLLDRKAVSNKDNAYVYTVLWEKLAVDPDINKSLISTKSLWPVRGLNM